FNCLLAIATILSKAAINPGSLRATYLRQPVAAVALESHTDIAGAGLTAARHGRRARLRRSRSPKASAPRDAGAWPAQTRPLHRARRVRGNGGAPATARSHRPSARKRTTPRP